MSLVNIKEMLIRADQENYAVPQFNVWNLEWISAVLTTCQELRTPVILGVSVNGAKYMGGYLVASQMIQAYMSAQAIRVPVALHLDHAPTFEDCKEAIDAGFTSVMIDASREELAQNIEITRKVVDYAHSRNVSVEAELGRVGGKEEQIVAESSYAIPEECLELVQKRESTRWRRLWVRFTDTIAASRNWDLTEWKNPPSDFPSPRITRRFGTTRRPVEKSDPMRYGEDQRQYRLSGRLGENSPSRG